MLLCLNLQAKNIETPLYLFVRPLIILMKSMSTSMKMYKSKYISLFNRFENHLCLVLLQFSLLLVYFNVNPVSTRN